MTAALITFMTGCSTLPPPPANVPIPVADLQPLAGDWRGEYVADAPNGPHGSLSFTLVPVANAASGMLTMNVAGGDRAFARFRSEQTSSVSNEAPQPNLPAIQFVRVMGSTVSGTIDAYLDPECQCPAVMTLKGDLKGDTIDGTFRATYDAKRPDLTGKWTVKRATTK
jgi:hypothetical protein